MGLSVDTEDRCPYVLEDRRALPAEKQPRLFFRYLSSRDHARMERLFSEAMKANVVDAMIDKMTEAIRIGLVGWENYDQPSDPTQPDLVLSRVDMMELARELDSAMTVSQAEKKASVSRSLSTSARSASAPVEVANV